MRIAVSGKSGCGNTTTSQLLAERLGVELINYTFRAMATELGIGLDRLLQLARGDDSYDRRLDARQVELARRGDCVIGSRLAIWLLPEADLSVYLKASLDVRVGRIARREGGDIEAVRAFTIERDVQDHERYKKLYGIDNDDYGFAGMIVDTDTLTQEEIVDLVLARLAALGKIPASRP